MTQSSTEKKKKKPTKVKSEAAKRGIRNKRKGNRFELEVVNKLKELGYNVASSRSQSKSTDDDKIDIFDLDGNLPVNIQTKYTQATPNYFTIKDACSKKDKPFTILWKKAVPGKISPGTIAMIPAEFFYEILTLLKK